MEFDFFFFTFFARCLKLCSKHSQVHENNLKVFFLLSVRRVWFMDRSLHLHIASHVKCGLPVGTGVLAPTLLELKYDTSEGEENRLIEVSLDSA